MANTKEKLAMLKQLHQREEAIYAEKNEKYGDSFASTFEKRGVQAPLIRLEDKLSRVDFLLTTGSMGTEDESVIDTLMDLSNYANMTIIELQKQNAPQEETPAPKPKSNRKKKISNQDEPKKEGPLDGFSKSDLKRIILQLGGTLPTRANRENLISIVEGFPKAKIAVAITSLKKESSGDDADTPQAPEENEEA